MSPEIRQTPREPEMVAVLRALQQQVGSK